MLLYLNKVATIFVRHKRNKIKINKINNKIAKKMINDILLNNIY